MNKVLFDLNATQPMGGAKRHGGGRYGEVVLSRIIERGLPVVCYYDSRKWLNPGIRSLLSDSVLVDISTNSFEDILQRTGCNTIYSCLPNKELFRFNGCRIIGTIHGLRRLEEPADAFCLKYKSTNWKGLLLFLFKSIAPRCYKRFLCNYYQKQWDNPNFQFVTVSKHTSNSLKVFFPKYVKNDAPIFYSPSTDTESIEINNTMYYENFFLLVSANRSEKNCLRAIIALDNLFSNGELNDFSVRITGVSNANDYKYKIKNKERFHFMGYVDDQSLTQLFHDTYCLIYPSLNEGFGYPPLEAMRYGKPVLASPFTSINEVCDNAAIYFNPFSIEEIEARILQIQNHEEYQKYSNRAKVQYSIIKKIQNQDLDKLVDYIYMQANT